jgi:uncharacterized protein YdaU (DUF1376 family)
MSGVDWFPLEPGRYLKNTLHLTTRQHGGYWLLIMAALENEGRLPGADAALASVAKLDAKGWKEDGDTLKAFLTREGDHWVHEYAAHLCADVRSRIDAKSKAGKVGAAKRWQGRANGKPMADASDSQWQNDAQQQEHLQEPVTTTPSVTTSAPAARAQLLTEKWEPTESEVKDLRAELSWINDDLWASRMKQFRDWCDANATRTFNPAATWRGFMRQTRRPFEGGKQWAKAGDVSMMPAAEEWGPRMAGWRQSKFWRAEKWGPAPGEPGCRAPKHLIGTGGTA